MFLLKQDVANGKTNGILLSYPNITVFTAGPAADLHSIYAGELRFTIGRVKKLVALDTRRFLCIPQTQQSGGGNYDQIKRDMGFIHLTPQIVLDGSGTNEIEIQYPTFAGWAGQSAVNGTEHRVVLYMRGLLVSGGSQITGGSQNE